MSDTNDAGAATVSGTEGLSGAEWNQIREALRGLRYGSVNIIIQDGVIVQIDRLEKRRIRRAEVSPSSVRTQF